MKAAMPITSWGLAIAAVKPSAKPAANGRSRRQRAYAEARPRTETPSHWPSTKSRPVPKPARATSTIATRGNLGNAAGQGAARVTSRSESPISTSWSSDQARQADPAPSSVKGRATTAAAGGFSNGMLSWPAGAPALTSVRRSDAGS